MEFRKSSLDGVEQCSRRKWNGKITYTCKQFDPRKINYKFTVKMRTKVYFPKIRVSYNPGNWRQFKWLHRVVELLLNFCTLRQATSVECLQFQSMGMSLVYSLGEITHKSLTSAKIIWIEVDLRRALAISWRGSGPRYPGVFQLLDDFPGQRWSGQPSVAFGHLDNCNSIVHIQLFKLILLAVSFVECNRELLNIKNKDKKQYFFLLQFPWNWCFLQHIIHRSLSNKEPFSGKSKLVFEDWNIFGQAYPGSIL